MLIKGLSSLKSSPKAGVGFFPEKLFLHLDVAFGFKSLYMACKVSIGNVKGFLHGAEVNPIVYHQHRHDAEPNPVLKVFIQVND